MGRAPHLAVAAAVLTVSVLLPGLPAAGSASPVLAHDGDASRHGGGCFKRETVQLLTFHIAIKNNKDTFAIGDTAHIDVSVTRPAHEDPFGQGVTFEPPASIPAAGINIGVGLTVGRVFLSGIGKTDNDGHATVKIKIERYTKPGWADVEAFAWKQQLSTPCLTVVEFGYERKTRAFKIIP